MATTNRGFAVPEAGDDVNIPGDLVNLTNSIIPSKTTVQIAAMSWADKPAGWLAYDTTLGKIVKSTGGSMVELTEAGDLVNLTNSIIPSKTTVQIAAMSWADKPAGWLAYDTTLGKIVKSTGGSMVELTEGGPYLPSAGGTLTGDLIFDTTNPDGHKVMFRQSGIDGWRIIADTGGVFAVQRRDPSTGAYLDNPLLITAAGHVESMSHMGVVASGTTNVAGYLTVPVLASPTGNWSVACNGARADTGAPLTVVGIPTSSTQVTFTCYWGTSAYQGAVQILYHLIAY